MGRKKSSKLSQPSPVPSSSPEVPSLAETHDSESVLTEPSQGASSSSFALLQLTDSAVDEESATRPAPVSSSSSALFLCQRAEEAARDGNLR
ncbi:hypothetical protein NL676_003198 [Syzygium grande]|nr:hypothetical protein NL676_003198 [Syzygium grande]